VLSYKPIYIIIWIIFFILSFLNIGIIMRYLEQDSLMLYVLPVYGTSLVLIVATAFFFFFMSFKIECLTFKAGIFFVLGSIIFYVSDSLIAHGKFNTAYKARVTQADNSTAIMVTYYICQYLINAGAFAVCDYFL